MRETEILRSLRAVRRFADQLIPEPVLQDIFTAARWTGSSKNTQPWELIVVRDRAVLADLARCGPFAGHLAGARAAVALMMNGDSAQTAFDEGRLAQNVMLAAWAHGIGSCIGSIYPEANRRQAHAILAVPQGRAVRTIISLGYPEDAQALRLPPASPLPRGRKPAGELVHWERYASDSRRNPDAKRPSPAGRSGPDHRRG